MTTYHAEVERDGRFWHVHVPEVSRSTQARNLAEVEPMARDLIAVMEDIPADSFDVDVRLTVPEDVARELAQSAELRQEAARAQAEAAQLARAAAQRLRDLGLRDLGLPLRDIGKVLGVTFQRAKQLLDEAAAGRRHHV